MSELERKTEEIPNVITGELVRLDDVPGLTRYLRDIRGHEAQVRDLKRMLEAKILEYARKAGTKTLRFDGIEAKVVGGPKLKWDVEKLEELLGAGLPQERYTELVTIEQTFKVNAHVANSIARSNPEYGRIIAEARSEEPASEHVSVSA